MFQLIYISRETRPFSTRELTELLANSRNGNDALGLTGMLLYRDGHFLQAIEGEETRVRGLAQKIFADPRHSHLTVLHQGSRVHRDFAVWSMGFVDARGELTHGLRGFTRFLESGLSVRSFASDPGLARTLLLSFKNEPSVGVTGMAGAPGEPGRA